MGLKYVVDKKRLEARQSAGLRTGMRVMAAGKNGVFAQYDIYDLDLKSLKNWLRQQGGYNPFAESAFALSMGHPRMAVVEMWPADGDPGKKYVFFRFKNGKTGDKVYLCHESDPKKVLIFDSILKASEFFSKSLETLQQEGIFIEEWKGKKS